MTYSASPVLASDQSLFPLRHSYFQAPQPMGRTLRRLSPEQDFSDLKTFVPDPFALPALTYKVASVEKGFLLIESGSDGIVFGEDGRYLREFSHFSTRGYRRFDLATLRAQAQAIDEAVFLGIDPGWPNYYHWLVTAIGRMALYDRVFDDRPRMVVADFAHRCTTPGYPPRFTQTVWDQTLYYAGLAPRILPLKDGVYQFRRLDVGWLDHPQPAYMACLNPFNSAMRAMRRNVGVGRAEAPGGRYILVREDTDRLPAFALESLKTLRDRDGFQFIQPEKLDFREQCALFSGAGIIVAPHGAGLTNLLMGDPRTKVLELNMQIKSNTYIRPWFYLIADGCGQDYGYVNMSTTQLNADTLYEQIRAFAA